MESVKKEIGDLGHAGPYRPPVKLRKRSEFSSKGPGDDGKVYEANEYVSALGSAVLQGDYCVWILYCKWPHTVSSVTLGSHAVRLQGTKLNTMLFKTIKVRLRCL